MATWSLAIGFRQPGQRPFRAIAATVGHAADTDATLTSPTTQTQNEDSMRITVHAYIAVTDLERGIEFYCQALDLRLEHMATALMAWDDAPDTFYARPVFTAIGWA